MQIPNTDTPVLILGCKLGGLAIMRSLGRLGIPLHGVDSDPRAPALVSKYCRRKFIKRFDPSQPQAFLDCVMRIGMQLAQPTILIPTSDDLSRFVTEQSRHLSEYFIFPRNDPDLISGLASKKEMYRLANKLNVPTAQTQFPKTLDDVRSIAHEIRYPVMLKGIHGDRLQARTGKKMAIVTSSQALIDSYIELEDPASPNLMIQEHIPGGDDQVYIFNGYFNEQSECLAAFTGHKLRQAPIHMGSASLGECRWNDKVATTTTKFMKELGYRGILDIGYRLDPRDGKYKVLDINPRIGQAFRIFVALNGMDVVRAQYLDLTGQPVESSTPRDGRRWIIEDYDMVSTLHYFQEGSLTFREWITSFKGVKEGAWFSWRDPRPFLMMTSRFMKKLLRWISKQLPRLSRNKSIRHELPAS